MASLVDSEAHLRARLTEVGFNGAAVNAIVASGVSSLSRLAFTVGQPGQPIQAAEVTQYLTQTLARAPTLAEAAALKRVTFEAHTFLVATLRQQVDHSESAEPRKIAFAERTSRMDALKGTLQGVDISGELDPSHGLLDRACAIFEQNVLKYLEPSTCICRSAEVQGAKHTKEISLDKGTLVVRSSDDKLTCSTDSELKLHHAFVRRAVAMEFAKLMSYQQHNQWMTFLFESSHRECPPGYVKPGLSQILQCDRAAFGRLASLNTPVRQAADGSYPLGVALLNLRFDPHISLYLAPLAKAVTVESQMPRSNPYQQQYDARASNCPKGKGKGKKGKSSPPLPLELRGKYHRTASGQPICFAFNTAGGCSSGVKPGEACPRGLHVCMEPKCQKPHSLVDHRKGGS